MFKLRLSKNTCNACNFKKRDGLNFIAECKENDHESYTSYKEHINNDLLDFNFFLEIKLSQSVLFDKHNRQILKSLFYEGFFFIEL